jgi:hypothetical protein
METVIRMKLRSSSAFGANHKPSFPASDFPDRTSAW